MNYLYYSSLVLLSVCAKFATYDGHCYGEVCGYQLGQVYLAYFYLVFFLFCHLTLYIYV